MDVPSYPKVPTKTPRAQAVERRKLLDDDGADGDAGRAGHGATVTRRAELCKAGFSRGATDAIVA